MFYQALESLIETKYQSGKTGLADLMRIRIKLNDFQNKLDDLNSALLPLQADFNKMLSRPDSDKINVSEDITIDILEDDSSVRDSILANNANLSVMHQQKEAALSQIESSKLESYPDIAFGLDYAMVTERPDIVMVDNGKDILMPMLSMNIPLFSSKYDAKVQEYEYQSEMIDYQIQDYQNKLSADYQRIITDKQNSLRNIKYLERQIKESYDVLEILYTEYSTKGNNYLDLIMQKEQIIVYEYKLELEKVRVNLSDALIDMLNSKN
jgi:cobalt-zinc-cadmium efflux system outer membrane protein